MRMSVRGKNSKSARLSESLALAPSLSLPHYSCDCDCDPRNVDQWPVLLRFMREYIVQSPSSRIDLVDAWTVS
jgi:hypothetical protein